MDIHPLTSHQASTLMKVAAGMRNSSRDSAILAVCIDAGPRRSELAAARRRDLDLDRRRLLLGEGDRTRIVRLGAHALAALRGALPDDPDETLIVSRSGAPLTPRVIHEQLLAIGSFAGLPFGLTARHTRRTYIAALCGHHELPVLLRLAGHGSLRHPAANLYEAVESQQLPSWESPLDRLLREAAWPGLGPTPAREDASPAA